MKNADFCKSITNVVIRKMQEAKEKNISWTQSWNALDAHYNPYTGTTYSGINRILLGMSAMGNGFNSNIWGTFNNFKAKGGKVKKNQKATFICSYTPAKVIKDRQTGDEVYCRPNFSNWAIFNSDQVEGIKFAEKEEPAPFVGCDKANAYFDNTKAIIKHGGDSAFYSPTHDKIQMPLPESFDSDQSYYGVLAHELTHWTGHKDRLDRLKIGGKQSKNYAMEELVAELGACFIMGDLNLEVEPRMDHAVYLNSWIEKLKTDSNAIFKAAGQANTAFNFVNDLQPAELIKAA